MLSVTTDHDRIRALVEPVLARDPVRGTILGSVATDLRAGAWCAFSADGSRIAVRSAAYYAVVPAGVWPAADLAELASLVARLPDLFGLMGPADVVEPVTAILTAEYGRTVRRRMRQRLYRLDALTAPSGVSGSARRAVAADRAVVATFYRDFGSEAGIAGGDIEASLDAAISTGGCWLWTDAAGAVVAMATRRPVVADSARIGPVFTRPAARGQGFGSAATAAATRDVLDDGAIPVLFTDVDNPVSNAIYQRLGYYPIEDRVVARLA